MSVTVTVIPTVVNPITKTTKVVKWMGVLYLLDTTRHPEEFCPGYDWARKATEADKHLPWLWRPRLKKVK